MSRSAVTLPENSLWVEGVDPTVLGHQAGTQVQRRRVDDPIRSVAWGSPPAGGRDGDLGRQGDRFEPLRQQCLVSHDQVCVSSRITGDLPSPVPAVLRAW